MAATDIVREKILTHGLDIASAQGLHSLSTNDVARDLDLPKSGVVTHFATKESLQLAVLEQAAQMFGRDVVEAVPADLPGDVRVKTLFAKWIAWSRSARLTGGCPFVHASAESEALPEPIRAKLKEFLDTWTAALTAAIDDAKKQRKYRPALDNDQLIFELYGLYLSHHFWHWSMHDPMALERTMKALDHLLAAARSSPTSISS